MHSFLLALYIDLVSSKFSNFGKTFLVAPPRMRVRPDTDNRHQVHFYVWTSHPQDVIVLIKSYFIPIAHFELNDSITLKPRTVSEYIHHTGGELQRKSGVSWSYWLHSTKAFALQVHVRPNRHSVSAFQVVPVKSWSRLYYAVTLFENPSIQIISNVDNNTVRVWFRFHGPASRKFIISNLNFAPNKTLRIILDKRRTLSIHQCDLTRANHNGSMTGTRVLGQDPIGVISGNCHSSTYTTNCHSDEPTRWGSSSDIVTEMLLPVEAYGTEFVVIALRERDPPGALIIVSSENETKVSIVLTSDGKYKNITLNFAGDVNTDISMDDNRMLFSNKKIQVVMMSRSACWNSDENEGIGDTSISLLVPNYLFYVEYFWITPDLTPDSFATLVAEKAHIEYLVLDNLPLQDTTAWSKVTGSMSFLVTSVKASTGSHSVASTHYFNFGCYLSGMKHNAEYMYPAGFHEHCVTKLENMIPDDGIDNDCDGTKDEETINGMDDDYDDQIDEDTFLIYGKNVSAIHGSWGEWEPWACFPTCEITPAFRMRTCTNPAPSLGGRFCQGNDEESSNATCDTNKTCIPTCEQFAWGKYCNRTCFNCKDTCDTRSGVCTGCKQGFKNPIVGCDEACGVNEYGAGCQGRCSVKCGSGTDCVDRVTGECPKLRTKYFIYSPLLMAVPVFVLLLITRKRLAKEASSENEHEDTSDNFKIFGL